MGVEADGRHRRGWHWSGQGLVEISEPGKVHRGPRTWFRNSRISGVTALRSTGLHVAAAVRDVPFHLVGAVGLGPLVAAGEQRGASSRPISQCSRNAVAERALIIGP